MSKAVELIPLTRLTLTFLPVAVVLGVLYRWSLGVGTTVYAMSRMLMQLLLIGYVLTFIFTTESPRNYGRLPMPELDELYEKSLRELDEKKRIAIFHEYQRRVLRGDAPAVTYGWNRGGLFVAKKIKGWSPGPTVYDNTSFTSVWLDQ